MPNCTLCHNTGWVIELQHDIAGITFEIIACPIPDCKASGQRVDLMSVNEMRFRRAVMHPAGGFVMSLVQGNNQVTEHRRARGREITPF